jgi:putative transposase
MLRNLAPMAVYAWKLFTSMAASDMKETLDEAVCNTGVNHIQIKNRPRLLSDNGPCYISRELKAIWKNKA